MSLGRVALTGGIATGKSVVRACFDRLGVPTIDADLLARAAVAPGTPGLAAVVERFGPQILDRGGALDRRAMAARVFADVDSRRALESIIHPLVREATAAWFASLPPTTAFAVADVPLLYEVGRDRDFDAVVVVACAAVTQHARLRARDGLTDQEAAQRIAAQWPVEEKVRRADFVVRTDGSLLDTEKRAEQVYRDLRARYWPESLPRQP